MVHYCLVYSVWNSTARGTKDTMEDNQGDIRYQWDMGKSWAQKLVFHQPIFLSLFQRQSLRYPIDNLERSCWYLWIVKIAKMKHLEWVHPALEQDDLNHFLKSLPALFSVTVNAERDLLHQLSFELRKSEVCNAIWNTKNQKSQPQWHQCRASTSCVRPSQLQTGPGPVTCWAWQIQMPWTHRALSSLFCCRF